MEQIAFKGIGIALLFTFGRIEPTLVLGTGNRHHQVCLCGEMIIDGSLGDLAGRNEMRTAQIETLMPPKAALRHLNKIICSLLPATHIDLITLYETS